MLLLVLITFVSGTRSTFVMDNTSFATNNYGTQMTALLLNSFTINANQIVAFLQNTGTAIIEITTAYVKGLITAIVNLAKIALTP